MGHAWGKMFAKALAAEQMVLGRAPAMHKGEHFRELRGDRNKAGHGAACTFNTEDAVLNVDVLPTQSAGFSDLEAAAVH